MFRASSHLSRIVAAAVSLPLVLFAVSFAHDLMRCRFTGVVVPACACPDDSAPATDLVVAQSCCERQTLEAISAVREEVPTPVSPPVLVTSRFDVATTARPLVGVAPTRFSYRPPGPALVLLKRSFLI